MSEVDKALTPRQIITAMSGLIIAMLLAQLDNMIVAPALPTIVGHLGGLNHLSWVVTGYILATAVSTPLWGKLGDLVGHKFTFMASIIIFLIGSAACGLSQNMTELVAFRALQGIGGGGLMVGIMSVIGMLVPPRERGKYTGIMMAVMPAAMIGGPLLGGFITDHLSWRWIFYVNLPLGLISLVVIWHTLNITHEKKHVGKVRIDWAGAAVLTTWITALTLLVTWGGTEFDWASWQSYSLGALAAVGLAAFVVIENRVAEPIMPLRLFRSRNFTLANALGFVAGFAMFGGVTFLPQFQQYVQGQSATNSGLLLMPMMIAAMVFSLGSGQLISRTGHYKVFPIVGTALLGLGLWLFSTMDVTTSTATTALYMAVLGAGMGCLMQTTSLVAQNSVELTDIGVATGTSTFTRSMGGSLGVAILGAIYAHELTATLTSGLPAGASSGGVASGSLTPATFKQLPAALQSLFQHAVVSGTSAVFFWGAIIAAAGFVVALFVQQVTLRGSAAPAAGSPATAAEAARQTAVAPSLAAASAEVVALADQATAQLAQSAPAAADSPQVAMIEYPFPLRPGLQAKVLLPENVTEQEVSRLVRYVESLAVNGEWQNQNHDGSHSNGFGSNGFETNGFGSNSSGTNGSGAAFAQLAESADGFHPGLDDSIASGTPAMAMSAATQRPRTDPNAPWSPLSDRH